MTAAPLLPQIRIDERASVTETRAFLERDRLMAAYALADLDPESGDRARWWLARREGEAVACVLLVEMLPFRPCFATGDSEGLSEILREGLKEPRIIVAAPVPARLAIESVYRFDRCDRMHRMAVDVDTFRPRRTHTAVRLGPERVEDVVELYGNASRTYFTPRRLAREIYFGVYLGNTLVAAAGTHVRSRELGIAAVGNVLTRLAYRNRGLATTCTSAVTEAALEQHRDVVLNVRHDNGPAVAVYQRLGYRTHAPFIEGPAVRRAAWDRLTKIFGKKDHA
ncbi:MAG TPA: GNAT family N-acetyltransferase [Candidatus Limnocylindria bacterium]|nr:GNAT family N-acetyltransferase [Candidatus Limnocylindria bacterium]